jgi:hypothetical protein
VFIIVQLTSNCFRWLSVAISLGSDRPESHPFIMCTTCGVGKEKQRNRETIIENISEFLLELLGLTLDKRDHQFAKAELSKTILLR